MASLDLPELELNQDLGLPPRAAVIPAKYHTSPAGTRIPTTMPSAPASGRSNTCILKATKAPSSITQNPADRRGLRPCAFRKIPANSPTGKQMQVTSKWRSCTADTRSTRTSNSKEVNLNATDMSSNRCRNGLPLPGSAVRTSWVPDLSPCGLEVTRVQAYSCTFSAHSPPFLATSR